MISASVKPTRARGAHSLFRPAGRLAEGPPDGSFIGPVFGAYRPGFYGSAVNRRIFYARSDQVGGGDNALRDLAHLLVLVARLKVDALKGLFLAHVMAIHQNALRALDQL